MFGAEPHQDTENLWAKTCHVEPTREPRGAKSLQRNGNAAAAGGALLSRSAGQRYISIPEQVAQRLRGRRLVLDRYMPPRITAGRRSRRGPGWKLHVLVRQLLHDGCGVRDGCGRADLHLPRAAQRGL